MPKKFTQMFDKSELEELFLSTVKPRNVNQKIFRFKLIQLFLNKGFLLCKGEDSLHQPVVRVFDRDRFQGSSRLLWYTHAWSHLLKRGSFGRTMRN